MGSTLRQSPLCKVEHPPLVDPDRRLRTERGTAIPRALEVLDVTSPSWLNAVEGFFAILTKRRLKRGVSRFVVDLQTAINRFLEHHNAHSKPFEWGSDPDKIIAAIKRGHQVLDLIQ